MSEQTSPYVPFNIRAAGAEATSHYLKLIRDGQTERFAEMCALMQPPGTKGLDRTLMEGRYNQEWLNDMPKHQADRIVREAKQAGINISGKFYMSGLADKRGHCDPAAWIDSTADISRVAEERNLTVSGVVNRKGRPVAPERKALSAEHTRKFVREEMAANPKLTRGEAKEIVRDKYAPKWKSK
jgi:hypothetical protein